MNISLSASELMQRLNETIAWCSLKRLTSEAPYDGPFLSQRPSEEMWSESELQPHLILTGQLRSLQLRPAIQESLQPLSQWVSNVNEVAAKRSPQHGAAQVQSLGFFDVDNVPPWDTWVAMEGRYLLPWVPPQMLKFTSAGAEVNPEECIKWADDPSLSYLQIGKVLRAMLGTES
jgi:hypothetical protein